MSSYRVKWWQWPKCSLSYGLIGCVLIFLFLFLLFFSRYGFSSILAYTQLPALLSEVSLCVRKFSPANCTSFPAAVPEHGAKIPILGFILYTFSMPTGALTRTYSYARRQSQMSSHRRHDL